jgi:hypothetical protein
VLVCDEYLLTCDNETKRLQRGSLRSMTTKARHLNCQNPAPLVLVTDEHQRETLYSVTNRDSKSCDLTINLSRYSSQTSTRLGFTNARTSGEIQNTMLFVTSRAVEMHESRDALRCDKPRSNATI